MISIRTHRVNDLSFHLIEFDDIETANKFYNEREESVPVYLTKNVEHCSIRLLDAELLDEDDLSFGMKFSIQH